MLFRSVLLLMGGYVATLVGVNLFFKNSAPTGLSAYAAALLPALPVIGVFVAIGRSVGFYIAEMQRRRPDDFTHALVAVPAP